ncbi:MAG: hypothetical protein HYV09_35950 [Deltaproteobacteria bacterium]|nr:hypothetical protein [Deltaproteobacteria bacterium]
MADAKHALELLSREPSAQRIAEMRREAEIARRLDRAEDLAEGREQGLVEGREEGLVEGREQGRVEGREQGLIEGRMQALVETREHQLASLRGTVESFCSASGIELDGERRATLASLDEAGLKALLDALFARRAWP